MGSLWTTIISKVCNLPGVNRDVKCYILSFFFFGIRSLFGQLYNVLLDLETSEVTCQIRHVHTLSLCLAPLRHSLGLGNRNGR